MYRHKWSAIARDPNVNRTPSVYNRLVCFEAGLSN